VSPLCPYTGSLFLANRSRVTIRPPVTTDAVLRKFFLFILVSVTTGEKIKLKSGIY